MAWRLEFLSGLLNDVVVPGDPRPSYEQLVALVAHQAAVIDRLEAEVAELKRQLRQNSRNSSKPLSADSPFVKPAPKSLRRQGPGKVVFQHVMTSSTGRLKSRA